MPSFSGLDVSKHQVQDHEDTSPYLADVVASQLLPVLDLAKNGDILDFLQEVNPILPRLLGMFFFISSHTRGLVD